jgi:hypothetical protein
VHFFVFWVAFLTSWVKWSMIPTLLLTNCLVKRYGRYSKLIGLEGLNQSKAEIVAAKYRAAVVAK